MIRAIIHTHRYHDKVNGNSYFKSTIYNTQRSRHDMLNFSDNSESNSIFRLCGIGIPRDEILTFITDYKYRDFQCLKFKYYAEHEEIQLLKEFFNV